MSDNDWVRGFSNASLKVVFCVALATGLSYCDRVNLSVAIVDIAAEFQWTDGDKAMVLGSFFWGYLLSQTLGATLAQLYGGKFVLGVAACFWSVLTLVVPMLARHSVTALVLGRVLLGITEGVTFPAAYYILRQFVEESARSRAIALVSIGTLSGAVLSFVSCPLLMERLGWESVFYIFGGLIGPVFVLGWFALVPSTPPMTSSSPSSSLSSFPSTSSSTQTTPYFKMLLQPEVFAICFAHFSHNLCHFALMSWLPTFVHDVLQFKGDSLALSSFPWISMGMCVGLSSLYADRLIAKDGLPNVLVRRRITVGSFISAGTCMLGLSLVLWILPDSRLLSLLLLTGALSFNGTSSAAGYEASKLDLCKTPTAASRLQSLSNTIATLGGVFGVPLVAILKGSEDNWTNVFFGLACAFYISALVFFWFAHWSGSTL